MTETEARLNSHEAVCAERYEQINARLKRIERIIMNAAAAMLFLLLLLPLLLLGLKVNNESI